MKRTNRNPLFLIVCAVLMLFPLSVRALETDRFTEFTRGDTEDTIVFPEEQENDAELLPPSLFAVSEENRETMYSLFRDKVLEGAEYIEFDAMEYGNPSRTEIEDIFALLYRDPEMFILAGSCGFAQTGTFVRVTPNYNPKFLEKAEDGSEYLNLEAYEDAKTLYHNTLDRIAESVDSSWTDAQKVLYINDYICTHYQFDYESDGRTPGKTTDAYTMIATGEGLSQAYTYLTIAVLERLGIEASYVSSAHLGEKLWGSGSHMWNIVKLNDNWYHLDVTMNDPSITASTSSMDIPGYVSHFWVLLSTARMQEVENSEHFPDAVNDWKYGVAGVSCITPTYDAYFWRDARSPVVPLDGQWYYLDKTSLRAWNGRSNRTEEVLLMEDIYTEELKYAYDEYVTRSGLFELGGVLYFGTVQLILRYNPNAASGAEWEVLYNNIDENGAGSSLLGCAYLPEGRQITFLHRGTNAITNRLYLSVDPYREFPEGGYRYYEDGGILYVEPDADTTVIFATFAESGQMVSTSIKSGPEPVTFAKSGVSYKLFSLNSDIYPRCGVLEGTW